MEPEGRNKDHMTKLIRKRKTRDLTNNETPGLAELDYQHEFPPPLWSGTRRYDPSDRTDQVNLTRLKTKGQLGREKWKQPANEVDGIPC